MEETEKTIEEPCRTINIFGDITPSMAHDILEQIFDIEIYDLVEEFPEPVIVNIYSLGGCAYSCQAIIDALESLKATVVTRAYGSIQSAGFLIYLAGEYRLAGEHTTFMCHEISYGLDGNLKLHLQEIEEFKRMQKRMNDLIKKKTKITDEDLKSWSGTEKYFDYDEAVKYDIVNALFDLDEVYRLSLIHI